MIKKGINYDADNDKLSVQLGQFNFDIDLSQTDNAALKSKVQDVFATIETNMSSHTKETMAAAVTKRKNTLLGTKNNISKRISVLEDNESYISGLNS